MLDKKLEIVHQPSHLSDGTVFRYQFVSVHVHFLNCVSECLVMMSITLFAHHRSMVRVRSGVCARPTLLMVDTRVCSSTLW
jgi:hypothetical protein